jgi:hypothetical protein
MQDPLYDHHDLTTSLPKAKDLDWFYAIPSPYGFATILVSQAWKYCTNWCTCMYIYTHRTANANTLSVDNLNVRVHLRLESLVAIHNP